MSLGVVSFDAPLKTLQDSIIEKFRQRCRFSSKMHGKEIAPEVMLQYKMAAYTIFAHDILIFIIFLWTIPKSTMGNSLVMLVFKSKNKNKVLQNLPYIFTVFLFNR